MGYDANGQMIRIGDYVDHAVKSFKGGIVVRGGLFYKGEPACKVDFPDEKNWTARLSKLRKVAPPKKTLANWGYKVGDKVAHLKYTHLTPLTITSEEVGEYRGEPCCYTDRGRSTRFSQIVPYIEPLKAPAPEVIPACEGNTVVLTLPNGKIVRIEIQ